MRRFFVLALLPACAHAAPIDDPKSDAPLHARVALRCPAETPENSAKNAQGGQRVQGSPMVPLSQDTLVRLHNRGYNRVTVVARVCEDPMGAVSCIDFGAGTRPREVAQTIVDAVQDWKYTPSTLNGQAIEACGMLTFNYKIQ